MTVVCLFVRGEYPYTPEYVTRLYAGVRAHLARPFRFVCLTDHPWLFEKPIQVIPVDRLSGFAYWTKLEVFNPEREWSDRMLYLDLDTLITAPLEPIIDISAPFALIDDPPTARTKSVDAHGRRIVKRFNSSVMVWDGGTQTDLYTDFAPRVSGYLSGDQDWIGVSKPNAYAMPRAWFPRISEVTPPLPAESKVLLVKVPKNHIAAEQWPWFDKLWRAA